MYAFLFPILGHLQTTQAEVYQFIKEIPLKKEESESLHILLRWKL